MINNESDFYLSDKALSENTKLTQWAYQLIDGAVLSATSISTEAALLRDYNNRLSSINAVVLQGNYKQLLGPEGQTTLIPLQNTELQLAVIQPIAGQYDYYLSALPAMLRDVSNQTVAPIEVHIPAIDSRWLAGDFETVLKSQGVQQIFDEVLADLSNLDAGGQYVSELRYEYDLAITPSGLSLASGSIVTTTLNPDNQFFNQDDEDGGTFGAVITQVNAWPCVDASEFYIFEPILLALVDIATGAINYLAEVDRLGDNWVVDCGS